MKYKYTLKYRKKQKYLKILKIPLFIILAALALILGRVAGDFAYDFDVKVISKVDTEKFKSTLNFSLPLIETVYNSGDIDFSIIGQISEAIEYIFGFNISDPKTVLNAQSPYFSSYYNHNYLADGENNDTKLASPMPSADVNSLLPSNPPFDMISPNPVNTSNPANTPEPSISALLEPTPQDRSPSISDTPNPSLLDDSQTIEDETKQIKEDASSISWPPQEDSTGHEPPSGSKISIFDETNSSIGNDDIERMLKEPLKVNFNTKKNGPKVLIYHTHTTESYVLKTSDIGKINIAKTNNNPRYNIVRVGDELTKLLEKKMGIDTIHNGTVHDYPDHSTAYSRSIVTVSKYLKSYPSILLSIDMHRDGVSGRKLRVTSSKNNKTAAKIMFVVGSSARFKHSKWMENLKLAVKLQDKLNHIYPGLAKQIYISKNRYNQHLAQTGITVEVGGDGNTLDEALESMKYLSQAIGEVMK